MDAWFRAMVGVREGVALVAVGGYGRRDLCPQSDIDVLLLHRPKVKVESLASDLWYPLWDRGLRLGNGVRTPKEAAMLAERDLPSATALLSGRLVAGDVDLASEVIEGVRESWTRKPRRAVRELMEDASERRERLGDAAFLLEPDLKSSRGGLRDFHALCWLGAADPRFAGAEHRSGCVEAHDLLLTVRVELHRRTGRPGDRFVLQEQDAVATSLGFVDTSDLMREVSRAARTLSWTLDDVLRRARATPGSRAASDRPLADGVVLRDGEVALKAEARLADPALTLRVAAAAAGLGVPVAPRTLERLRDEGSELDGAWPDEARLALVRLLGAGPATIAVIEALDQYGLMARILPEWEFVRNKPQRNVYHRFTVDRHLCEAAVEAAAICWRVVRPDLLLVGAFLHDIGKGWPGDHTDVGVDLVGQIAPRMGFDTADTETLVALVRHHLLLPDVATRRDLEDPATVEQVATAVGSVALLDLLAALTEADSIATGPQAWSRWRADLLGDLVRRVRARLDGDPPGDEGRGPDSWVTADHRRMMEPGEVAVLAGDGIVRVAAPDRPGLFSRVAGALALQGLDIVSASAAASPDGVMAIEEFKVMPRLGRVPDWDLVAGEVERAVSGKTALGARIETKVRDYSRPNVPHTRPHVSVDLEASTSSTVVEVRAADGVGVLYAITRGLADCDLDIRSARVQTLGHEVIDTFYVRMPDGSKPVDSDFLVEVERAVLAALGAVTPA